MIYVEEAVNCIQSHVLKCASEKVPIQHSVNRVLAETVYADRDFPPFNRVAMDGIAIDSSTFMGPSQEYVIEDTQGAGTPQKALSDHFHCMEVMTGAILPLHTDAVIRYEDLIIENGRAKVLLNAINKGLNVHARASDAKAGDILLKPGQRISPAEVAILAAVGKREVIVYAFPKTVLISSGDELVDIHESPLPHQIRRSNMYALQAAMQNMGWVAPVHHLPDHYDQIMFSLRMLLSENDVLILSGGVSKGKFDFIPKALTSLNIHQQFHQVSQKPGKPFWFGTSADKLKVVFALPGNPVSTFVCFYKYIFPWVLACWGIAPKSTRAILTDDVTFQPSLTYFLQVAIHNQDGRLLATPVAGGGSGDFANLSVVDGFIELPANKTTFKAGESYPFISFRV